MENQEKLTDSFWHYIESHQQDDPKHLALTLSKVSVDFSKLFALAQIKARQKVARKLPTWISHPRILFPKILSAEQASSEQTALWKNTLFPKGKIAIDLTGGLGVDVWAMAQHYQQVLYVEREKALAQTARHNFKVLACENVRCICAEASAFLEEYKGKADLIYIDPARRALSGKKVVRFSDCSPNVVAMLPLLQKKSNTLLIKASPMMDIQEGIQELSSVCEVAVVAVENEVKELLFKVDFSKKTKEALIRTVDLKKNSIDTFDFYPSAEKASDSSYGMPQKWMYEPNAALLKAGAFKSLAVRFDLKKLHPNTHIYTSERRIEDFPGKVFSLINVLKYNRKEVQKALQNSKANVKTRNFPDSPQKVLKKLNIKEGGTETLIGVRLFDESVALLHLQRDVDEA